MKVIVEGCAHGELDNIYDSIIYLEQQENIKVDILLCCGDFQSARNEDDLACMAVPAKYNNIRTFHKYYSGEKQAPVLTVFIGGNHEASNYLQELPYGGWVAPNIFYLGYAGVVNIGGLKIAGISGIYKGRDYMKGHYEKAPYNDDAKRSVYHIRNVEVFRLKQLAEPIDIFLSHDWPSDIFKYGNLKQLLRFKPFFKDDIEADKIGSPPCQELLELLKPTYWFAAHLHCKFAALVDHDNGRQTKFLALDKCLPNKRFMQVLDIPHDDSKTMELSYDLEWLAILNQTNHLMSYKNNTTYMPGPNGNERWQFTPSQDDKENILQIIEGNLTVPKNFVKTAKPYSSISSPKKFFKQPQPKLNPQTKTFCTKIKIDDPLELLLKSDGCDLNSSIESDVQSDQSFLYDSEEVLDSSNSDGIKISPMQRLSLNLPKPKDGTIKHIDFMEQESVKNMVSEDIPNVEDSEIMSKTEPVESCDKNNKIFKRRNANIYNE